MHHRLGSQATDAFLDPNTELYLSIASYWEICIKISIGKLVLADDWIQGIEDETAANGIQWLSIIPKHCQRITKLPLLHNDPFDRLLIAQALCEEMTLLTADKNIARYPAPTLW
jgi:PIN domain nuclease of toxin-antitoxin system